MRAINRVAALVAIAAWLCPKAYAPIFGTYPGLHSLIEQSQIIAAVTILDRLPEWDFGGSDRYKIEFAKVFKGSPPQKQAFAWLRNLEIITQGAASISPRPSAAVYLSLDTDMCCFS